MARRLRDIKPKEWADALRVVLVHEAKSTWAGIRAEKPLAFFFLLLPALTVAVLAAHGQWIEAVPWALVMWTSTLYFSTFRERDAASFFGHIIQCPDCRMRFVADMVRLQGAADHAARTKARMN